MVGLTQGLSREWQGWGGEGRVVGVHGVATKLAAARSSGSIWGAEVMMVGLPRRCFHISTAALGSGVSRAYFAYEEIEA